MVEGVVFPTIRTHSLQCLSLLFHETSLYSNIKLHTLQRSQEQKRNTEYQILGQNDRLSSLYADEHLTH